MFIMSNRRDFAGETAPGDYAVPGLANPVQINPEVAQYRSDYWGKVGEVGGHLAGYWGGIWDIMTGKTETEAENFTPQEKAEMNVADGAGSNSYFIMFALAVGAYYFLKKGA